MLNINLLSLGFVAASATWIEVQELAVGRSDHSCGVYGGKIIACGGCVGEQVQVNGYCPGVTNSCEIFDPIANTWSTVTPMPRQRYRFTGSIVDGKFYAIGGVDVDDNTQGEVDVYDFVSNLWTTVANMTEMYQATDQSALVFGDKIVIAGGYKPPNYDSLSETHIFDTVTNSFQYNVSNMVHARGDMCSAIVNGTGYTHGGFNDDDFCNPRNNLERFEPNSMATSGTWYEETTTGQQPTAKGDKACLSANGRLFALGGETKVNCESEPIDEVESYDPIDNIWYLEADMVLTEPRFRFCGAAIGDDMYIIGGQAAATNKSGTPAFPILNLAQHFDISSASILSVGFVGLFAAFLLI